MGDDSVSVDSIEFGYLDFYFAMPATISCVFGTLTNAICIVVFFKMKGSVTFKYMLAQSISDFIYLSCLSFILISFSLDYSIRLNLATQIYCYLIRDNLASVLGIFYVFVEAWICLQRYSILRKKSLLENISGNFISFDYPDHCLCLSFIYIYQVLYKIC